MPTHGIMDIPRIKPVRVIQEYMHIKHSRYNGKSLSLESKATAVHMEKLITPIEGGWELQ